MQCDLVLIHPPSIYDFREKTLHYGPVSDVVPSSPVFDLYPIGFLSTLTYLASRGFKVRIINLAANMLINSKFDVEEVIKGLDAYVFGIDLHWLVHVQGAIEVAKIIKKIHPDKKVVLGGLSSTVFWKEILKNYEFIDFVLLGDSTELPMEKLLENVVENRNSIETIPNIAWRGESARIRKNDIVFVPESLDEFSIDYGTVIKESLHRKNFFLSIPFAEFMSEPIGASLSYKGCIYNCITCGGSKFAYNCFFKRDGLGVKSPKKIFEEVKSLSDYMRIPIFILGDLQLLGKKRVRTLARMLRNEKIDNTLLFEFFYPPSRQILSLLRKAADKEIIQLSPETQNENVRYAFGKKYSNRRLFDFIRNVIELNVNRLDLYFMIGLPKQDYTSVAHIPEFIEQILKRLDNADKIVDFFTAPLAPFLDPGSKVFTNPKPYGYNLLLKNFEEYRKTSSLAKSWKDSLNYENAWISREEIAEATYDVAEKVTRLKIEKDMINEDEGLKTIETIREAKKIVDSNPEFLEKLTDKETITKGDLYPTRGLLLSIKPKFFFALFKNLLGRG